MAQAQEERSQRSVQDEDDKSDHCWTEACEGIARRILKHLGDGEVAKSQHERSGGTSPVSKRVKDQYCAHCEASKK